VLVTWDRLCPLVMSAESAVESSFEEFKSMTHFGMHVDTC